jgi:hypothetical protein
MATVRFAYREEAAHATFFDACCKLQIELHLPRQASGSARCNGRWYHQDKLGTDRHRKDRMLGVLGAGMYVGVALGYGMLDILLLYVLVAFSGSLRQDLSAI